MKRFFLFTIITFLVLSIFLLSIGTYLAENRVFAPGSILFPLQELAEEVQSMLFKNPESLFKYELEVAFRRLDDLQAVIGTNQEPQALKAFLNSLDRLATAYSRLSAANPQFLETAREDLLTLLDRADPIMRSLVFVPTNLPERFAEVETKLHVIRLILANPNFVPADLTTFATFSGQEPAKESSGNPDPAATISPQMVQFLPGSNGALHNFFPLTGKHGTLVCESCHTTGVYKGTDKRCIACHVDVTPANHYPGDCALCHITASWKEIMVNHKATGMENCQVCHSTDKPSDHYSGQCSGCHSTNAWKPANFNHSVAGATDCQSCHTTDKPANHYPGQCSACHNTNGWLPASFNHSVAGATNCQSCHADASPANHYNGQCSACHSTSGWLPASFNHSTIDTSNCQSCHTPPAGHYNAQCSACHSTAGWKPASFNHSVVGATNCLSCHVPPAGHYTSQCSACHNTSGWRPANFNHQAVGATDCQSCHGRPANHFQGQCSNCHSTNGWIPANFNHNFPMDHGDANNECSKCHPGNTGAWTCYSCHDQGKMDSKHAEKGISDISSRCLECHPTGKND